MEILKLVFGVAIGLVGTNAFADNPSAEKAGAASLQASTWKNQRGSSLVIASVDQKTGAISGTYTNRAPGFPLCAQTPYPLVGWVYGSAITFTVRWKNTQESCDSITAWSGNINFNDQKISTIWHLTIDNATSLKVGADEFTPDQTKK
jgi:Avidin family